MSEFGFMLLDAALSDVEGFMKYLARKNLTAQTEKRRKRARDAVRSIRSILETERHISSMENLEDET